MENSMNNPQLKPPTPYMTYDDVYTLLTAFKEQPPTEPPRRRHQFMNFDFWFMFIAMCLVGAVFTSYIPTALFEPLLTGAIVCMWIALSLNLTRERVELPAKKPRTQPLVVFN